MMASKFTCFAMNVLLRKQWRRTLSGLSLMSEIVNVRDEYAIDFVLLQKKEENDRMSSSEKEINAVDLSNEINVIRCTMNSNISGKRPRFTLFPIATITSDKLLEYRQLIQQDSNLVLIHLISCKLSKK